MNWLLLLLAGGGSLSLAAGPFQVILDELLDVGGDLADSVSDLFDVGHEDEDTKMIGLAAKEVGCAKFSKNCKKCVKSGACGYCAATDTCAELGDWATCEPITKKRKCPGGLSWWQILLIVLACICLAPLIAFCCFVYVIKKLCCPNDTEMDD